MTIVNTQDEIIAQLKNKVFILEENVSNFEKKLSDLNREILKIRVLQLYDNGGYLK